MFTFIPIYHRLKVYTAYEFLEQRFDLRTRALTASLFNTARTSGRYHHLRTCHHFVNYSGLESESNEFLLGALVVIYTVSGGTKAVNVTQKQQMFIIMTGMFLAFYVILESLPPEVNFTKAMEIAGSAGKLNLLDFSFNMESRYTFWSGITGGLFLSLSYFGTDQSQVQRYLSGKSIRESQLGLIFNGILKVPMQFFILLVGVMVFVFISFLLPCIFNENTLLKLRNTDAAANLSRLESKNDSIFKLKTDILSKMTLKSKESGDTNLDISYQSLLSEEIQIRSDVKDLVKTNLPEEESNDKDYVFISFILAHLPKGLIGLCLL